MRSSMLVLLFLHLVSVQAASTIEVHPIPQSPLQHPQPRSTPATTTIPTVDPKLFSKRRHRSPRVLFSERPPDAEPPEEHQGGGRGGRTRRRVVDPPQHRGVYSVCESVSIWVGNKTKATDISGNEVIVLPDVKINNVNKRQYFFETTCSNARAAGSGCLGIDGRHWNSYCTNSHTFVRALTSFKNLVAWRLIRINVACVCVLSRKSWRQ